VQRSLYDKPLAGPASFDVQLFLDYPDEVVAYLFTRMPWDGGLLSVQVDLQVVGSVLDFCSLIFQPPYEFSLLHCLPLFCFDVEIINKNAYKCKHFCLYF
jgi:hypothetical protein